MSNVFRESKVWLLWLTVLAVLSVGVGVFFYYLFFRQSESDVVESVPTDAVFVFDINDNEDFATKTSSFSVYLNEIFALEPLQAFETLCSKIQAKNARFTISAHRQDDGMKLLFNLRATKQEFKKLLRTLKIDPKNFTTFENCKIYSYGTDFQNMKFVYSNNVISFSTDPGLLKKAILQQIYPKKIFSNKEFNKLYGISEKNRKQNWLFVEQNAYFDFIKDFLKVETMNLFSKEIPNSTWSCFQIRFSKNEIFFSGYSLLSEETADLQGGDGFGLLSNLPVNTKRLSRYETHGTGTAYSLSGMKVNGDGNASKIPLQEVCVFTYQSDTNYVTLAAALPDSSVSVQTFFNSENVADSILRATVDNIYPLPADVSLLFTPLVGDTVKWFAEVGGAFVFSPSRENLSGYRKLIQKNDDFSKSQTYGLISDAVASSTVREFAFFNEKNDRYFNAKLSDKGAQSRVGQNIRAFSLSYGQLSDNKFIPVNVYILFQ